jgi:hypothetical protein
MKSKFRLFYNSYFTVQSIKPIASLVYKAKGPDSKATVKVRWKTIFTYYRMALVVSGLGFTQSGFRVAAYFIKKIKFLRSKSGIINTVKYLKTCSVMIQQAMAGHIEKDLTMISGVRPSRSKSGLPAIIPSVIRRRMKSSSFVATSRFILSVFSLFRDIPFPGESFKTDSITDSYSGSPDIFRDLSPFIKPFVRACMKASPSHHFGVLTPKGWRLRGYIPKVFTALDSGAFPIWKSSPQTGPIEKGFPSFSTHPRALHASAWSLAEFGLKDVFLSLAKIVKGDILIHLFNRSLSVPIVKSDKGLIKTPGKLGLVKEAAGKVRVFAMVDPWTQ